MLHYVLIEIVFWFSYFPIFWFSHFPKFPFSDFLFSNFPIFLFSYFPIFWFSYFPIFLGPKRHEDSFTTVLVVFSTIFHLSRTTPTAKRPNGQAETSSGFHEERVWRTKRSDSDISLSIVVVRDICHFHLVSIATSKHTTACTLRVPS